MAKKKNYTKYIIIGAVLLLIVAIAGNKAGWFGQGKQQKVSVEKALKRDIIETVSASGKVQPEIEVKLSSEVSGEIVELHVKEGDVVKKGELLCKVKPDILRSGYDRAVASLNTQRAALGAARQQLKQAEASFKNTAASFKRSTELFKQKVISAAEFDAARAQYYSAQANLEALRQNIVGSQYGVVQSQAVVKEASDNLARTTIYAPVDGVVSKLSIELGERVVGTAQMAGTEIMRISNLSSMEVNVNVNENDINRVSVGDVAQIEVDAFRGKKFRGVVSEIASSSNINTLTSATEQVTNFTVKIRIAPESYAHLLQKKGNQSTSPFRPGLSATVDIETDHITGLTVPIASVTTRDVDQKQEEAKKEEIIKKAPVRECVFIVKDGIARQVFVETGIQNDTYIHIVKGLKANEDVITGPFNVVSKTLKDGDKVEVVSKEKLFDDKSK